MALKSRAPSKLAHVTITPSIVLELAYAFFRVVAPEKPHSAATLPWLRELELAPPDWFLEARRTFQGPSWTGFETLLMALALGYGDDPTPERFLLDFPTLPRLVAQDVNAVLGSAPAEAHPGPLSGAARRRQRLRESFELLSAEDVTAVLARALRGLWVALEGYWVAEGLELATRESAQLLHRATSVGDVLDVLPRHHFITFDTSIRDLRQKHPEVKVSVTPLYFAAMGGYKFLVNDVLYLGYGIRSERLFRQREEHVDDLAGQLRAFSDPTRLLLLVLISRLRRFPLTVGDLARQLGVSQPTASGHLRLLRELGLVEVVRRGNRSYYRVRKEPIRELLTDLSALLLLDRSVEEDG